MIEFAVESYKGPEEFGADVKVPAHARPLVVFNGEGFAFDTTLQKAHNLLIGSFWGSLPMDSRFLQRKHQVP